MLSEKILEANKETNYCLIARYTDLLNQKHVAYLSAKLQLDNSDKQAISFVSLARYASLYNLQDVVYSDFERKK